MRVRSILAQAAVEALDTRAVGRFARPPEVELDAALIGSLVHHVGTALADVVGLDGFGQPALGADAVERLHAMSMPSLCT